jgi:hypothetical protein
MDSMPSMLDNNRSLKITIEGLRSSDNSDDEITGNVKVIIEFLLAKRRVVCGDVVRRWGGLSCG